MPKVRAHLLISGLVQGVYFRHTTRRVASAQNVTGWVRNLPDGRVEALACGDADAVNALEGRLWEGPPHARVAGVEAREAEPPAGAEFRVLPTPW